MSEGRDDPVLRPLRDTRFDTTDLHQHIARQRVPAKAARDRVALSRKD